MDACDQITKDKNGIAEKLVQFGIPNKCPVEKVRDFVFLFKIIDVLTNKILWFHLPTNKYYDCCSFFYTAEQMFGW